MGIEKPPPLFTIVQRIVIQGIMVSEELSTRIAAVHSKADEKEAFASIFVGFVNALSMKMSEDNVENGFPFLGRPEGNEDLYKEAFDIGLNLYAKVGKPTIHGMINSFVKEQEVIH